MEYTVILSEAEHKSLEYVSAVVEDWINSAIHNRASNAMDEICKIYTEYKISHNEPITAIGRDAIVLAAFEEGLVKTAAQRNEEAAASLPS